MKRRILEIGKDLLILLLLCSLLLLALATVPSESLRSVPWLASLLRPLAPVLGLPQAELTYVEAAQPVMDAAQPLTISVRNSAGRYSAIWDFERLDAAFETLGGALGEALDTAGELRQVSLDTVLDSLAGPSVCFRYGCALPAALLASWLDASIESSFSASAYALALSDSGVTLYFLGESCAAADTAVQPEALSELLEQYRPDGSQFAFETISDLDRLSLLPGSSPTVLAAAVSDPCDSRYVEQLATELGFNPYGDAAYTDAAGSTYFTESNCALQVSPGGRILLTSSSPDRFQAAGSDCDALVEEARRMVELVTGSVLGDARIYLSGLTQDGDSTVCTFDYVLAGIPVAQAAGSAAAVTFRGRALTSLEVRAATYRLSAEALTLLPAAQAAAILPEGSFLTLLYQDSGTGSLAAGWVK